MKNIYRPILTIIIILIIIASLAVFIFRQPLFDLLRGQTISNNFNSSESVKATDSLDLEVLKSPTLIILRNNVKNFDYEAICKRPNSPAITKFATSSETATSSKLSVAELIACSLGNNFPFLKKTK